MAKKKPCPLPPFAGTVVIDKDYGSNDQPATDFARSACGQIQPTDPKIFENALIEFCDASAVERAGNRNARWCSCAVVWRMYGTTIWETEGKPLYEFRENTNSELKGLVDLLSKAERLTTTTTSSSSSPSSSSTTIATTTATAAAATPAAQIKSLFGFCDSKTVVEQFRDLGQPGGKWPPNLDKALLEQAFTVAEKLEKRGVRVHVHWVRGHQGVEGNELADRVAAAHRPDVLNPLLYPSSWRHSGARPAMTEHERLAKMERERENRRHGFTTDAANRRLSRLCRFGLLKKRMKWLKRREKVARAFGEEAEVGEKMRKVRDAWTLMERDEAEEVRALPLRLLPSVAPAPTVDEAVGENWVAEDEEEDHDDDNDDDDDDEMSW